MKTRLVGTAAALGALLGCGIFDSGADPGNYNFELREEAPPDTFPGSMSITLIVTTEVQSPCLTHALQGQAGFGDDRIIVSLNRVALPSDVCIPSDGPAEFRTPIAFGPATVNHPFYLTFATGSRMDQYLVIISESAIDISPLHATFTHALARRIPRGG
jgi:hypothetical protein